MTKHVDPRDALLSSLMESNRLLLDDNSSLRAENAELRGRLVAAMKAPVCGPAAPELEAEPTLLLQDFTGSLAAYLLKRFKWREREGGTPSVWLDEKTGQHRASLCDILDGIGFRRLLNTKEWGVFWSFATLHHPGHYEGRHLKRNRRVHDRETLCVDLEVAEALIIRMWPKKGPKMIADAKMSLSRKTV